MLIAKIQGLFDDKARETSAMPTRIIMHPSTFEAFAREYAHAYGFLLPSSLWYKNDITYNFNSVKILRSFDVKKGEIEIY